MANAAYILATGHAVPDRVVTNDDLVQFPAQMRPMIALKTGIRERRHADDATATSDLAAAAARRCLERAGVPAEALGGIVVGSCCGDKVIPPTAAIVHDLLGAPTSAFAFDVAAVCSSALYALTAAVGFLPIARGPLLVIGADATSKLMNPRDFSSYPYFGDGAGALLLAGEAAFDRAWAQVHAGGAILGCDGSGQRVIEIPAGGTREPSPRCADVSRLYFRMEGRKVLDFAIEKGAMMVAALAAGAGGPEAVHAAVLHQANLTIIHGIADRCRLPRELFPVNLDRYGNTGAAGVLIALDEVARRGPIPTGKSVVLAAFGGGLAWAGCRLTAPVAAPIAPRRGRTGMKPASTGA
jgi:3-oxoacyl-[acyl-carrier-protein] synthase III